MHWRLHNWSRAFADGRRAASVRHSIRSLLAQRVYGLCCGWEDVSDHNTLRRDLALQTAVGRAEELASAPTLSRLESSATMEHAAALHGVLLEQFIASRPAVPDELVLDIDATHMPLYGRAGRRAFPRPLRQLLLPAATCSAGRRSRRACCARAGATRPAYAAP